MLKCSKRIFDFGQISIWDLGGYLILEESTLKFSILCPIDFSKVSLVAFAHALKLTVLLGAKLTILRLETPNRSLKYMSDYPPVRATLAQWGIFTEGIAVESSFGKLGIAIKKTHRKCISPHTAIVDYLREHHVDLIVVSIHSPKNGVRYEITSTVFDLIQHTHDVQCLFLPISSQGFVSILDGSVRLRNILVPMASEPSPQSAIEEALALASVAGNDATKITLMHVGTKEGMPKIELPALHCCKCRSIIRNGNVIDEITSFPSGDSTDLVVMTTRSRKLPKHFNLSSVAAEALQKISCPVLTIPVS
jgi:nucleotide-binding universal stress UspA family protein